MIGTSLGHFRILRKLGKGGMGEVYLAEDTKLGRKVALKLLPEEITQNADRRNRFQREARAVAALNHPHIVTVHSVEEIDGRAVIVLEYIRGKTLAEMIPRAGFPLPRVLELAIPLADAVAAAHRQGVIHRDLKPSNVMVDEEGRVKVLDFGLARIEEGSSADGPTASTTAAQLVSTEEGKILGTIAYMSPEQLEGRRLDHRTDIFSLGVLFYEMCTGRRPFQGESRASVISSILRDEPPSVTDLKDELPRHFNRILRMCLAKDPERRFQTVVDVRNELTLLKEESESGETEAVASVKAVRPRRLRRALAVAIPVIVVVAVATFLQVRVRIGADPTADAGLRSTGRPGETLGAVRRLTYSGKVLVATWSPTSDEIAYSARHGDRNRLLVIPASGGTPRVLDEGARSLVAWNWTPDGKSILVHHALETGGQGIVKYDLYGAPPRILCENAVFPDLSPDGRTLLYYASSLPESTGVWTLDLGSGERTFVIGPPPPGKNFYKAQWSPAGDRIAFSKWTGSGHELWVHDMASGADRRIESGPVHVGGHYDWTGDGKYIATAGSVGGVWSTWMIPVDGGEPIPLTQAGGRERHASPSSDGQAVVFTRYEDTSHIVVLDLESGDLGQPLDASVSAACPAFTPDGRQLLFQAVIDGRWQIWSGSSTGGDEIRPALQIGDTWSFAPTVLPDGSILHLRADNRPIVVWGAMEWAQTLWLSSKDGGRHREIESAGQRVYRIAPGSFYTDRWLVSTIEDTGSRETVLLLKDGESPRVVWEDGEGRGVSAFDWGRRDDEILLAVNPEGSRLWSRVVAMDPATGEAQVVADLAAALGTDVHIVAMALDPTRKRIAFLAAVRDETGEFRREILVHETSTVRRLHVFEPDERPESLRWSPDGRRIAIDLPEERADLFVWESKGRSGA